MNKSGTPGGNRLRALREYAGRTQLDVELDASLGMGYLQRVESGKVQHPEKDTLERILAALAARYSERREILELFGYVVDTPLPNADEIQWAVEACQRELDNAVFPAYLLDCAHRLLVWNAFLPRLYRVEERRMVSVSMLRLLYDPQYGIAPLVSNPDVFFAAQIRALRYEMQHIGGEAWHQSLLNEVMHECPLFRKYWEETDGEPRHPVAARPLFPLELTLLHTGRLQFWLTSEPFAQDRRFRVIYYLPADSVTMQQCVAWVQASTSVSH
jgi:transcriptional regulator with XRE-family HTH domain